MIYCEPFTPSTYWYSKKVLYTSKFTIAQFAHYVTEFQLRRMVMMKNWVIREDMTKSHIKNYATTKLAHVLC